MWLSRRDKIDKTSCSPCAIRIFVQRTKSSVFLFNILHHIKGCLFNTLCKNFQGKDWDIYQSRSVVIFFRNLGCQDLNLKKNMPICGNKSIMWFSTEKSLKSIQIKTFCSFFWIIGQDVLTKTVPKNPSCIYIWIKLFRGKFQKNFGCSNEPGFL